MDRVKRVFRELRLVIFVAIVLILVTLVLQPSKDERCRDICTALKHRTIKATHDACICEDPETGKREAHPFQRTR